MANSLFRVRVTISFLNSIVKRQVVVWCTTGPLSNKPGTRGPRSVLYCTTILYTATVQPAQVEAALAASCCWCSCCCCCFTPLTIKMSEFPILHANEHILFLFSLFSPPPSDPQPAEFDAVGYV